MPRRGDGKFKPLKEGKKVAKATSEPVQGAQRAQSQ